MTPIPQSLIDIKAYGRLIHKDDTRWGGEPYHTHTEWIADQFTGYYRKAVSYLHDTVEDHPDDGKTLKYILDNFGSLIAGYVEVITHLDKETYEDYITRIGESLSLVAIEVKQMDLTHNSKNLLPGSKRLIKYQTAHKRLEEFAKKAHRE
jgi:(p)ppGpp synthase/HD superfamily hydrolase